MPVGNLLLRKFAGVNRAESPRYIKDEELVWTRNFYQQEPGVLRHRPIYGHVGAAAAVLANTTHDRVLLMPWLDAVGKLRMMAWVDENYLNAGEKRSSIGELLAPYNLDGSIPANFSNRVGGSNHAHPDWLVAQGGKSFYVAPGPGGYAPLIRFYVDPATGAVAWEDKAATWAPRLFPTVIGMYRGGLVLTGFDPNSEYGPTVMFTPPGEPETLLDPSTKSTEVGFGDGDTFVAVAEVPVVGGSQMIESYIYVMKRHSVWVIRGDPPLAAADENGTLSVVPLIREEGCVSRRTVVQTPHGLIWCSGKNVWLAQQGAAPIKIGNQIASLLAVQPQTDSATWHAVYYKGFYRLTVPALSDPRASLDPSNTDLPIRTEQWWCDLRKFPEEWSWWGPMVIPSHSSAVVLLPDGQQKLQNVYIQSGSTTLWIQEEGDSHWATDNGHENYDGWLDASANPAGNWGLWWSELRFKEFDFGDPMIDKLVQAVELSVWMPREDTFEIEMLGNGGAVYQIPAGPMVSPTGFILGTDVPVAAPPGSRISKEFQALVAYPPDGGRFIAKTWQPIIRFIGDTYVAGNFNAGMPEIEIAAVGVRVRPIGRRP